MGNEQNYVSANGLTMYYETQGAGTPLILVHGGLGTGQDWQAQIPIFTHHYQVIIPDSRGHGRTDNPAGTLSYRMMADDLAAFVQGLGLQKPLIYGYSDGANIALEFAVRYPDLARAVVVLAAWFKFSEDYQAFIQSLLGDTNTEEVDIDALIPSFGDYIAYLRASHASVYGDAYLQTLLNEIKALWLTPLNYTIEDFQQIRIPTLIAVGDRDEAIPVEEAAEMYRRISTAELYIAPNTDHGHLIASEAVAQVGLDFLLRHGEQPDPAT